MTVILVTAWKACQEALDDAMTKIDRLEAFASGHGMVSEAADISEVAVLVVGLHERIARVEQERDAANGRADANFEKLEEAQWELAEMVETLRNEGVERDALHADLDLQIKRTEEARNERDALREKLNAIRNSPVDTPADA